MRGIGTNSAWLYVMELFGWRAFRNRKEVGAIVGLVPTPAESGQTEREQGMPKAGQHAERIAKKLGELGSRASFPARAAHGSEDSPPH